MVSPIGNVDPDAGVHTGVIVPSTRSIACAVKVAAPPAGLVDSAVTSPEVVTTGAVVSVTNTSNVVLADVLPAASRAVQPTGVWPSAKMLPDAGAQSAVPLPSTASWVAGAE